MSATADPDRKVECAEAASRRGHLLRGNVATALMHLANAQKDLANTVRISPMRGVTPAIDVGLQHALDELGKARTKVGVALAECQGIADLEEASS